MFRQIAGNRRVLYQLSSTPDYDRRDWMSVPTARYRIGTVPRNPRSQLKR